MNRKMVYRRILLAVLAITLIFSVYYMDKHPLVHVAGETQDNVSSEQEEENDGIPKLVFADTKEKEKVYPCGFQVGIYLQTKGVMIIGTDEVEGIDGVNYNPALNKVKSGDYITKINDIDVSSKSQLIFLVNKYGDKDIILTIMRNGNVIHVKIVPVKTGDKEYKMGIWVRDDTQGIGTMTYMTGEGEYAALGHGISDIDTGELLDSEGGILYQANVWGIKKGEAGYPGALYGMISYEANKIQGSISENTDIGIYGQAKDQEKKEELINQYTLEPVEVAPHEEIHTGTAYLRSYISGKAVDYEVQIQKINKDHTKNKGIVLKVTDKNLLELTGGIVQGMSGTPILQDGRLVGAVTHVFVNDATMGYGIFADVMMNETNR